MFTKDISIQFSYCFPALITFHFVEYYQEKYDSGLNKQLGVIFPSNIEKSVNKRKADFLAGRLCANSCLNQYGLDFQVAIGNMRQPMWPSDFRGSISHTSSIAGALVIKDNNCIGVGLDIENIMSVETAKFISRQLMGKEEAEFCYSQPMARNIICTLVFSAKESFFKAAFPEVKRYFDFYAVTVVTINKKTIRLRVKETLSKNIYPGYETDVNWMMFNSNKLLTNVILYTDEV